jgi:PAS domain-containing protein
LLGLTLLNLQSLISRYQGLGEQWRAHLLGAILKLAIPITFVLTLVSLFDARSLSVDVVASSVALVFEIIVWRIWAKGKLDKAASILIVGSTIITSLYILLSGGVMSPLLGGQIFLAAMAALLTSTRFTLATIIVLIIFNIFTLNSPQLPPAILSETPLLRLAAQIAYLVITAGTILYSIRILKLITLNLANSEHRFRALFEKTSDAVFISGLDLRLIEVNAQAARMLDYAPEEMAGLPVRDLFPADEWAEVQKRFDEVKSSEFLAPATRRFISKTAWN